METNVLRVSLHMQVGLCCLINVCIYSIPSHLRPYQNTKLFQAIIHIRLNRLIEQLLHFGVACDQVTGFQIAVVK